MGVSPMLGLTGETTVPRQTLSSLDSTDVKILRQLLKLVKPPFGKKELT
jgi:hypothetical protein